jgi:DNA repair protein RecO
MIMERKNRSYCSTEGIVLNAVRANEADMSAVFLTPHRGKLKGLLKSARRSRNRFRGNVETGGVVKMMLYFREPGRDQERITDISILEPLRRTRSDMRRILIMNYILDIVNSTVPLNDPDPGLYGMLKEILVLMENTAEIPDLTPLLRVFEMKLLLRTGIHPELKHCSKCGKRILETCFFHLSDLSVFCHDCRPSGVPRQDFMEIRPEFLLFYYSCLHSGIKEAVQCGISRAVEKQSRLFFKKIYLDYLGKSLKVPRVARGLI